jgi:hypothetical protein
MGDIAQVQSERPAAGQKRHYRSLIGRGCHHLPLLPPCGLVHDQFMAGHQCTAIVHQAEKVMQVLQILRAWQSFPRWEVGVTGIPEG